MVKHSDVLGASHALLSLRSWEGTNTWTLRSPGVCPALRRTYHFRHVLRSHQCQKLAKQSGKANVLFKELQIFKVTQERELQAFATLAQH